MPDGGFGGFPGVMVSKTLYLEGAEVVKKVMLQKLGRQDNATIEVYVATSSDETNWSAWEQVTFGTIVSLVSPGKYLRVLVAGQEGTVFYSKNVQGKNIGVEIDVLEVA